MVLTPNHKQEKKLTNTPTLILPLIELATVDSASFCLQYFYGGRWQIIAQLINTTLCTNKIKTECCLVIIVIKPQRLAR